MVAGSRRTARGASMGLVAGLAEAVAPLWAPERLAAAQTVNTPLAAPVVAVTVDVLLLSCWGCGVLTTRCNATAYQSQEQAMLELQSQTCRLKLRKQKQGIESSLNRYC
jgi:hypothetical protein